MLHLYMIICAFSSLFCTQQGCQERPSDDKEWSMGSFDTAQFNVDSTGSVSLQFTDGDNERYCVYYQLIRCIIIATYL